MFPVGFGPGLDSVLGSTTPSISLKIHFRGNKQCIVHNGIYFFKLEGRKISGSQFLKVLSTLRVWEICAPDINAAIEVTKS